MRRPPLLLAALACTAWAALFSGPAAAAEFRANFRQDVIDGMPGDGICDPGPQYPAIGYGGGLFLRPCSLRAAIEEANLTPEPDTIFVDANPFFEGGPAAVFPLSLTGPEDPDFPERTGDLDIRSTISIEGESYVLQLISGRSLKDRIFDVHPEGHLLLQNIGVFGGRTAKGDSDPGRGPGEVSGGCIRSRGALTLVGALLHGCRSTDDGGCLSVLEGSLLANTAVMASCRAKGDGGALFVGEDGSASVTRLTIGANRAASGGGVATRGALSLNNATFATNKGKFGGSIAALGAGSATVNGSTIVGGRKTNLASEAGAMLTLTNSIVTGAKQDCDGSIASGGGNLESGFSCGLTGTHDQQGLDPLLGPLQLPIGASLLVFPLLEGSPAIDHGVDGPDACADADAVGETRIEARPTGGVAIRDAGAVEFAADAPPQDIVFTSTPPLTATVGEPFVYDAETTYNRPCPLTYLLTRSPDGAVIDPDTGVVTWTPTQTQVGVRRLRVRAESATGFSNFQIIDVEVLEAPTP